MLQPVAEPVAPEPRRPLPALRADQALLSDEEWQALLCPSDAMPLACAVHAGEKPDSASEEGSLS